MSRRRDRTRSVVISLMALAAMAVSGAVSDAAEVAWHDSFEETLAAAQAANKPMLVFVHMGMTSRHPDAATGVDAHEQMATETLTNEDVVIATGWFECFELDLRSRANDHLRGPLKVAPVRDDAIGEPTLTATYPITLFLDSSGRERFRLSGSMPPLAYAIQLKNAKALLDALQAVDLNPQDAVARRNLGRAYMELYLDAEDRFYLAAMDNLAKAIELDPDNETGANYNARVDLTIFRLPDDPQKAFAELFQLQTEDPERSRRFEIQYYMAVAQYASGDPHGAVQVLESFETADRDSPYFSNKWTALALGLLKYIRLELERGG